MKRLFLLAALASLVCALPLALPVAAQEGPYFDLNADTPGGPTGPVSVIEIPPDDVETFWAHIGWAGHDGEPLHIASVSWHVDVDGEAQSWVEDWLAQESQTVLVSEWFPWNVVHTIGVPSTLITFQADVVFHDATGAPYGPIWSNTVTKHITPEPSSMLALGVGAAGIGGLLLRKRTS